MREEIFEKLVVVNYLLHIEGRMGTYYVRPLCSAMDWQVLLEKQREPLEVVREGWQDVGARNYKVEQRGH